MKAYERLLNYVVVPTQSDEATGLTPSTKTQFVLAEMLEKELYALGAERAHTTDKCYTYGFLPATPGLENAPALALIAHLDTATDFSGEGVKPQVIENYDGGDVPLGDSGRVLSVSAFPHLPSLRGRTLITTDGSTLLGADDKAGIAEIMTALERIITEKLPHGPLCVCFTPDEEIGGQAAELDIELTGAKYAFTLDGGEEGELEYECFNAAAALFEVSGFNIHPGSAKGMMINAQLVAMEINSMLPSAETPRDTEGYEGFYHLCDMSGNVEKASLSYIVRDFDPALFEGRINTLRHIEKVLNEKWGAGTVKLTVRQQYRNMLETFKGRMEPIDLARDVILEHGLTPDVSPIRGGTDGAALSLRGLPCPNLGTGGYAFHGPYEHITAEGMDKCVDIILGIVGKMAELKA